MAWCRRRFSILSSRHRRAVGEYSHSTTHSQKAIVSTSKMLHHCVALRLFDGDGLGLPRKSGRAPWEQDNPPPWSISCPMNIIWAQCQKPPLNAQQRTHQVLFLLKRFQANMPFVSQTNKYMKYPVRGPSPIAVHGPIAVHSAIFSHLFWTVYFTTQWSTITGPSPIAVHAPITVHGSWNEKTSDVFIWIFSFSFFFLRMKGSQMKKRTKEEAIEKDPVVLKNARRSCLKFFCFLFFWERMEVRWRREQRKQRYG